MNQAKESIAPLMLCAAIISAVSGCATVSPWQYSRTASTPIGVVRTIKETPEVKAVREKQFDISEFVLDGGIYKAKVTESAKVKNFAIIKSRDEQQFADITFEKQTKTVDGATPGFVAGCFVPVPLYIAGVMSRGEKEFPGIFGALLITPLFGLLTGLISEGIFGRSTTVEKEVSRRIRTNPSNARTIEELSKEEWLYKGKLPSSVRFGFIGQSREYVSDGGIIILPELTNEYFTKERLANGLEKFPLMQQVKDNAKRQLEEMVLAFVPSRTRLVAVETRETSSNVNEIIKNGVREQGIAGYILTEEAVYSAVAQFVQTEINPNIKPVSFRVEDKLTHVPIANTRFKFDVKSPSKLELAGEYFTGNLQRYAERLINNYLVGNIIMSCPETLSVDIYSSSSVNLEVVHPDYNFVRGIVDIANPRDKVVYMIDKGQKVRVESSNGDSGSIE